MPTKMLSHNGHRERNQRISELSQGQVLRMTSNQGVTWYWNPLSPPLFGDVFEAMMKSSKRAICAIPKDEDITDEDVLTTLIGV